MIHKLSIQNFRSLHDAEIELGKINVLIGPNNSGKSSYLYALMVLRNFFHANVSEVDFLFRDTFIDLGGFSEVFFNKSKTEKKIKIGIESINGQNTVRNQIEIEDEVVNSVIGLLGDFRLDAKMAVGLPIRGTRTKTFDLKNLDNKTIGKVSWGGQGFFLDNLQSDGLDRDEKSAFFKNANMGFRQTGYIDFLPIENRLFTKNTYPIISTNGFANNEEELASMLRIDSSYEELTCIYFEKVTGCKMKIELVPGTSLHSIRISSPSNPESTLIVNEGAGINQVLYMLAKILNKKTNIICIDEPEIHLHPAICRNLASALVEIVKNHDKQIILTTHSESLLMGFMNEVMDNRIDPNDIRVYGVEKQDGKTNTALKSISPNGQIVGGLSEFYQHELGDLEKLFGL